MKRLEEIVSRGDSTAFVRLGRALVTPKEDGTGEEAMPMVALAVRAHEGDEFITIPITILQAVTLGADLIATAEGARCQAALMNTLVLDHGKTVEEVLPLMDEFAVRIGAEANERVEASDFLGQ